MSHINIMVHTVWRTKNNLPLINLQTKKILITHIRENAKSKSIHIHALDGYRDHMHCLISLSKDQQIGKIVQLIKGESSHWLNKHVFMKSVFAWGEDYYASSVSPWDVQKVKHYIARQEEHHKRTSYAEEIESIIRESGFLGG